MLVKLNKMTIYSFIDWIIPAVFIFSFFECYLGLWRLSTSVKFVSILLSILLFIKGHIRKANNVFVVFFILIMLSSIAYLYNGRPLTCLSSDMMNTVPAMLLFLVGQNDNREGRSYYDKMMYAGVIVMTFGIVCYVLTPGWYTNSLLEAKNTSQFSAFQYDEGSLIDSLRFSSFFDDSYPISLLSVYILSISLFNVFRKDNRLKYSLVCVFISFIAAILCMHRISIACAILILLIYLSYEFFKGKTIQIFKIIISVAIIIVVATLISDTVNERMFMLKEMLTSRTEDMSFSSAYNERQGLSQKLMSQWSYPIFGHGIGSGGPTSRFLGYGGVTDAAYTKLLFENGIMGMMTFIILIISTLLRGLRYFRYFIVELSIVCFVVLAMTGSNTLSLAYLYILPFWYMMGRIWNKQYLQYARINNIKI